MYSEAALRAINELCAARGLYHVSDEVYEYFTFDGARHYSPASAPDAAGHTISMFSLSKAYGMAGLRVGYVVYPAHLDEAMFKIQDTVIVHATIPAQHAACGALETGRSYTEPFRRELAEVRDAVRRGLESIADICTAPAMDGAFYCLLRVRTPLDAMTVTERLIREHRIAVLPGTAFGMADGCSLRIAYGALERDSVGEGVGRLVNGLRAIVGAPPPPRT